MCLVNVIIYICILFRLICFRFNAVIIFKKVYLFINKYIILKHIPVNCVMITKNAVFKFALLKYCAYKRM